MSKFKVDKTKEILLQLFNDQGDQDDQQDQKEDQKGGQKKDQDDSKDQKDQEKVFTQKDLDDQISKRLERERKKQEKAFKDSDEYKAFSEYQDNQKSEKEKAKERDDAAKKTATENETLKAELQNYRNKEKLSSINNKYREFVLHEINKGVNDENDFDAVLKTFMEDEENEIYMIDNSDGKQNKGMRSGKKMGKGNEDNGANAMLEQLYGKAK